MRVGPLEILTKIKKQLSDKKKADIKNLDNETKNNSEIMIVINKKDSELVNSNFLIKKTKIGIPKP
jgi:DNA gyrase/topoisomerase IV subunit A